MGKGRPPSCWGDLIGGSFCPDKGRWGLLDMGKEMDRGTGHWGACDHGGQVGLQPSPDLCPQHAHPIQGHLDSHPARRGLLGLRPELGRQRPAWSWAHAGHSSDLFDLGPGQRIGDSQPTPRGHVGPGPSHRRLCEHDPDSLAARSSEEVSKLTAESAWTSKVLRYPDQLTKSRGCCPLAREVPRRSRSRGCARSCTTWQPGTQGEPRSGTGPCGERTARAWRWRAEWTDHRE